MLYVNTRQIGCFAATAALTLGLLCAALLWLAPESCPDAYTALVAPETCP